MECQSKASLIIFLTARQERYKHSKVELSIQANGKESLDMDKENKCGKTELNIRALGKTEKLMDMESSSMY
jgi:hypothetical protein